VGSVHSDLIAAAPVMPALGSSVLGTQFTLAPGGKAGNQATQIARLGIHTWLVSSVGSDALGAIIVAQLTAAGIDQSYLVRSTESPTGASTIFAVDGEYASIIVPGAAGTLCDADLNAAAPAFQQSKFVVAQLELGLEIARTALGLAWRAGATTVLNASPLAGIDIAETSAVLEQTDILVVNRHEANLLLADRASSDLPIIEFARRLRDQFELQAVIITCGADGSLLARKNDAVEQPAFPISVVDSIGAGDAFLGALIAAWADRAHDREALRSAAAAGALAASSAGAHASLPDRSSLRAFLRDRGLATGEHKRGESGSNQEKQ
jgi:ribokinase